MIANPCTFHRYLLPDCRLADDGGGSAAHIPRSHLLPALL